MIELGEAQNELCKDEDGTKTVVFSLKSKPDEQAITYINKISSDYWQANAQNPLIGDFNFLHENTHLMFAVDSDKLKEGFALLKEWIAQANQQKANFEAEIKSLNVTD